MDVCSAVDIDILPGQTVLVPTGLKVAIPAGYEIQVRPRSGLSLKTALRIPNAPGTIDAGYRDELCVIMTNTAIGSLYCSQECGGTNRAQAEQAGAGGRPSRVQAACSEENVLARREWFLRFARQTAEADDASSVVLPVCLLSEKTPQTPCIYRIMAGDRIAQLVPQQVPTIEAVEVSSVSDIGEDRGGGFGSTGTAANQKKEE